MEIAELIAVMGIPTSITGLMIWWVKRYIDKRDKRAEEREKNIEELMLLIVRTSRANNILATATAKAVQRIPDAHCNGDMTSALEMADRIQKEEKDFMFEQGMKHVFGDS
jgi:uncharacterized protein YigA (DUF484 family)